MPSLSFTIEVRSSRGSPGRVALVRLDRLGDVSLCGASFVRRASARPISPRWRRNIDARFANFSVPTGARRAGASGLVSRISVYSRAAGRSAAHMAVTILVVPASVAMKIRSRTVEIGTLRAVGFDAARWPRADRDDGRRGVGGALGTFAAYAPGGPGPQRARLQLRGDVSVVMRRAAGAARRRVGGDHLERRAASDQRRAARGGVTCRALRCSLSATPGATCWRARAPRP
jgi:hypothetical protein